MTKKFIDNIMFLWYGGSAGYYEFQKSKKIAEAMANNDANKIKIAGEIEESLIRNQISLIEQMDYSDKMLQYSNLYNTLTKAVPKIKYDGEEMRIDIDKAKRLKDLSKDFSSDEMQEYIAGIIAGEYNNPGTYSLQTISILRNLSRDEVNIFRRFCGMVIEGGFVLLELYNIGSDSYTELEKKGIGYDIYLYMQELGILNSSLSAKRFQHSTGIPKVSINIGGQNEDFNLIKETTINVTLLTKAGRELYNLVEPIYDDNIAKIIKMKLATLGFEEIYEKVQ